MYTLFKKTDFILSKLISWIEELNFNEKKKLKKKKKMGE